MSGDSVATVRDRPSVPSLRSESSVTTPEQAMRLFEARRAWTFAVALAVMSGLAIPMVLVLGGDPFAQGIHVAGLAVTCLGQGTYALLRRDPARYRSGEMLVVVLLTMSANITGFFYWGEYSAYLSVVTVAGYAFASGARPRDTIVPTIVCMVAYAAIGGAQLAGWLGDHALIRTAPIASRATEIVALVVLEVVILISILGGLDAHRKMETVLAEHHAALRELSRRDAQLAEAHAEVRAARAPGEGRYSGETLGRFRLGRVLGRGAMGEVYDATDDRGMPCAVKVLAGNLLGNADALRRFQREARAIASVTSPNIVRMIEVSPADDALPFFAMERLEGETLADLVKTQPVRELGEVIAIARALAAGLDIAHEAGVIHRDLKPANVFGARDGDHVTWKILDFGVSKLHDEGTLTGAALVGTPSYMAPEQARGDAVDRRADIYALGVIAYRLLTGRPAVVPGEVPAMLHEVAFKMPPRPSTLADVPSQVELVLAVALAKAPGDRFATAGELAAALAEAGSGVLSPAVAERAQALVARAPWGQWLRRERRKTIAD